MTVTLVSMVRNEAPRIGRMIESAVGLVDRVVILDTGSTDDTPTVAAEACDQHALPVEIHYTEWVDFGTCRTELYRHAHGSEWQLLLDADMTVTRVHPDLRAWLASPEAAADAYQIQLSHPGLSWRLPLLTRGDLEWRYVGAIHEHLDTTGRTVAALDGLDVWHHGDNGYPGKLDERLALLETERTGWARYYTAQTLRDLGRTAEAVDAYRTAAACADLSDEYRWHARYQAAALAADRDGLLAAWHERPDRAEPLRALARTIPQPADGLFVETDAYQ